MSNNSYKTKILAEIAICCALSLLLNYIPHSIASSFYVEISVIPLLYIAMKYGLKLGFLAGLISGLLTIVTGNAEILQFWQGLLEYILAPVSLGFAGIFQSSFQASKKNHVLSAVSLAVFIKYFWHFLAGIIFWSKYAWSGWGNGWKLIAYSGITNGVSAILTSIFAIIVIFALLRSVPKLFQSSSSV